MTSHDDCQSVEPLEVKLCRMTPRRTGTTHDGHCTEAAADRNGHVAVHIMLVGDIHSRLYFTICTVQCS